MSGDDGASVRALVIADRVQIYSATADAGFPGVMEEVNDQMGGAEVCYIVGDTARVKWLSIADSQQVSREFSRRAAA